MIMKHFYLPFQNCKHYVSILYTFFELLDVEQGSPISHKTVKCDYLGLVLTKDPTSPRGNFVHYNFQILHYISHKMKYVITLRVAALTGNIMLRMLVAK